MGWGFLVDGMALGEELGPVDGLAEGWGRLAEGFGVGWWVVDMLNTSEIDAGGNDGLGVDDVEGILSLHREL